VGVRKTKLSPICLLRGSFGCSYIYTDIFCIELICLKRKIPMKTCFGDGTSLGQNVGYGVLWVFVRFRFDVWVEYKRDFGCSCEGGSFFRI
jgi:hypothetical protein